MFVTGILVGILIGFLVSLLIRAEVIRRRVGKTYSNRIKTLSAQIKEMKDNGGECPHDWDPWKEYGDVTKIYAQGTGPETDLPTRREQTYMRTCKKCKVPQTKRVTV